MPKKKMAEAAYEAYKRRWVKEHVDRWIMEQTMANYDNRGPDDAGMTFNEYVAKYGFANGMRYDNFDEFVKNMLTLP